MGHTSGALRSRNFASSAPGPASTLENAHRDTPPKKPVTAPARRQIFVESGVTEGGDVSMRARGGGLARRDCGVAVGYLGLLVNSETRHRLKTCNQISETLWEALSGEG